MPWPCSKNEGFASDMQVGASNMMRQTAGLSWSTRSMVLAVVFLQTAFSFSPTPPIQQPIAPIQQLSTRHLQTQPASPARRRSLLGSAATPQRRLGTLLVAPLAAQRVQQIDLAPRLDDTRTKALFAWLQKAVSGDARYNNLMLAFAAVFADVSQGSVYSESLADLRKRPEIANALEELVNDALSDLPHDENVPVGQAISLEERERGCLGAMGAGTACAWQSVIIDVSLFVSMLVLVSSESETLHSLSTPRVAADSSGQWTGSWRTRPHALLDVRGFSSVDEWVKTLPRGARRTLAKAKAQNFTVSSRPIHGNQPAPHSVDPLTLCSAACVWRLPCLPFWPLC